MTVSVRHKLDQCQNLPATELEERRAEDSCSKLMHPRLGKAEDLLEADLENVSLGVDENGDLILTLRAPTSSNFVGQIIYESSNGGQHVVRRGVCPGNSRWWR